MGLQNCNPYDTDDRRSVLHNVRIVTNDGGRVLETVLDIRYDIDLALAMTLAACAFHESLLSKVMPKYVYSSTTSN